MESHLGHLPEIAVILLAAFAGGAVFNRLRQPALVGYIFAGIVLGPSVTGLVQDQEQIRFMADLGILLLLFVVGIELDIRRFIPVYKLALSSTAAQIATGMAIMSVLGYFFDWPLQRILLIGFAVSLSSTAVAIKLLQEMGEANSQAGRAAVGILIAQDIAVIPFLLIMSALAGEASGAKGADGLHLSDFAGIAVAMAGMGGLMYVLATKPSWLGRLVPAFLKNAVRGEQTVIAGLAFCFLMATLAGMAGLSQAYGAFMAGLIIGNTANKHEFEDSIKPVFNILMMVFFLSIGLLIDVSFLQEKFWRVLAVLFLVMVSKTVVNIWVLRFLGLSRRNAFVMGAVLGQVGEFSFVLAALGLSVQAILPDAYKYVVTIIALSLVVTPLWLYALRRLRLLRHNYNHRHPMRRAGDRSHNKRDDKKDGYHHETQTKAASQQ